MWNDWTSCRERGREGERERGGTDDGFLVRIVFRQTLYQDNGMYTQKWVLTSYKSWTMEYKKGAGLGARLDNGNTNSVR